MLIFCVCVCVQYVYLCVQKSVYSVCMSILCVLNVAVQSVKTTVSRTINNESESGIPEEHQSSFLHNESE